MLFRSFVPHRLHIVVHKELLLFVYARVLVLGDVSFFSQLSASQTFAVSSCPGHMKLSLYGDQQVLKSFHYPFPASSTSVKWQTAEATAQQTTLNR